MIRPATCKLGEEELQLTWEEGDGELIVSADRSKYAAATIWGFGKDVESALKNLQAHYDALVEFATESDEDWWHKIYR